ncbi:MAG: phosphatidate cytidylyltransferase, partial [Candidatus Marinimicrobia bacterium]|nr:phosphatidate cytidylyltransferase [Candidatus Neomarinimicrobiota bacterium]
FNGEQERQNIMNKEKGLNNFATRMIVNVLGIPAILLLIKTGRIPFATFIALVTVLAQIEFYNLMTKKGFRPWVLGGLAMGIAWIVVAYLSPGLLFPLMIFVFLMFLGIMLFKKIENAAGNIAVTMLGFIYIPVMLSLLIVLRESPNQFGGDYYEGSQLLMIVFASIWICDSLAFVFGKWLGRIKIAPSISPGKSWAGCIAGLIGASITVYIFYILNWKPDYLNLSDMLVIGIISGIFGQAGDFIESVFKRDAEVKDSGTLLMGHGGVLDRFDSFLFAPAFVYLYVLFFI